MHLDLDMVLQWVSLYGPAALFVLLILGIVGLPVPDETLMVFCGALIGKGTLNPLATFSAAFAGSVCGITISYIIGRTAGKPFLDKFGPWMHLTPARLEQVLADAVSPEDGALQSADDSFTEELTRIQSQLDRQNAIVETQRTRLLRQFQAMETALGQLQSVSSLLGQQLTSNSSSK